MDNVYVYFDITWTEESTPLAKTSSRNYDDHLYAEMTEIANNIYWAYVPRVFTNKPGDKKNIGFASVEMTSNSYTFYSGSSSVTAVASTRGDYNKALNLFVPYRAIKKTAANYVDYYDDGYWKIYGSGGDKAGYKIKRWNGSSYVDPATKGAGEDWQFVVEDENTIVYELRIDHTGDDHWNRFKIYSIAGTNYNNKNAQVGDDITSANGMNGVDLHDFQDNPRFEIVPTTEGIYTLTIDQSSDMMSLTVNYPIAVGDYRIKLTYGAGGAKKACTDVIKATNVGSPTTVSMYINTSPTGFVLEKCTAITPSLVWAQQGDDLWSTYSSMFNKGKGVYQFDVTISNNAVSSIENVGLYEGEYYVKTDVAPGGWTAYRANVMEANTITFDKTKPETFDHSFCHWVNSTSTNIKCVIANDYNNYVSDTLEGDAIIGVGTQTLPSVAHVRFSYNSVTNELKRTYLALTGDDHLLLEGNAITEDEEEVYMIHNESTHNPFTNNKTTLENQSNFTFMLDLEAREKARVRLSATYNEKVQDLVGTYAADGGGLLDTDDNTVEIIGGSTDQKTYNPLRIIYDFKTNQLLSAWLVPSSGDTPDKELNTNLMIIREGQNEARQITFSGSDDLTKVDTVYSVMKFNKNTLNNSGLSVYERDLYWISFPYNVRLSDAFGMGTYGTHWIIERYDGKTRAQNGFWADSPSNWKFITPYQRDSGWVLNANEGYILALDLVELDDESYIWDNGIDVAYLYFPSNADIKNIKTKSVTVDINQEGYECTIGPRFEGGDDRRIKDSYWHCIGAPSFANKSIDNAATWCS